MIAENIKRNAELIEKMRPMLDEQYGIYLLRKIYKRRGRK